MKKENKISKKELTAELHNLGIKTYRKKSTGEVFVKEKDMFKEFHRKFSIKPTDVMQWCIRVQLKRYEMIS